MNPESPLTDTPPEAPISFLDSEVQKAEEAEITLKASLSSFLEDDKPAAAPENKPAPSHRPGLEPKKVGPQSYDFRNPMLLSPGRMHKLHAHQEEFTQSMAARLSVHLRTEFVLKVTGIQTIAYQKLAEGWGTPSHLSLFKMEPLRGVSILEFSYHLGLCMVDRLMGGNGHVPNTDHEISEIEKVLLEQTVQLFLDEWCAHWSNVKGLKPVLLGYENFGGFIQTAAAENVMLVVDLQAEFGECKGRIQIAAPYAAMEPLLRRFGQNTEQPPANAAAPVPAPAAPPLRWNTSFDDVSVSITAEWEGLEMTARQILEMKVGDVLSLPARQAQLINVRVADVLRFQGRPGTIDGQWAVQLTHLVNPPKNQ